MRSATVAILIAAAVLVATLAGGPLFSRLAYERAAVEVASVTFTEADGVPVVDTRVRSNESYALTGEVWFVVTSRADGRAVFEHPPVPFGPLEPRQSAVLRLERPDWAPAEGFTVEVFARETFSAPAEPAPEVVPSSVTLQEQGVEITLSNARLERLPAAPDSAQLSVALVLANLDAEAHDYRVIFTLQPVDNTQGTRYQSPFQDLALGPGQSTALDYAEQVAVAPGSYVLSGWLQMQNDEGLYEHVVKVDAAQILTVGE